MLFMVAGTSINWSAAASRCTAPVLEVTLSGSGRKAGAGKAAVAARSAKATPSLCKAAMLRRWQGLRGASAGTHGDSEAPRWAEAGSDAADQPSYRAAKLAACGGHYARCWASLRREPSPFALWVLKPERLEAFKL